MGEDSKDEDRALKDSAGEDSKKFMNETLKDDAVEVSETNEDETFKNHADEDFKKDVADEDSKKDDNPKDGRIPVESAIKFSEIGKAFNITLKFSTVSTTAVILNKIL